MVFNIMFCLPGSFTSGILSGLLEKEFPKERGSVFIPCYELWWRGSEQTKINPLFPGYVFFYSDLRPEEIHIITRKVVDVNVRQRKAYLDISINGHVAKAGLYIMGKRHYFPNDDNAPFILSDGAEVDTRELSMRMMGK